MNPPEPNDPLDALLREPPEHVADHGFTARVVSTLPRRRLPFWQRQFILQGATLAGAALALWWVPWHQLPPLDPAALVSLNSQVLLPWLMVMVVMGSFVGGIFIAAQSDE